MALAGDATALLGHDGASPDTADIASYSDDVREGSKPFLLMGSSLTAVFAAGVMALAIILAVNFQPTVDRGPGETTVPPSRGSASGGAECARRAAAGAQDGPRTRPGAATTRAHARLQC